MGAASHSSVSEDTDDRCPEAEGLESSEKRGESNVKTNLNSLWGELYPCLLRWQKLHVVIQDALRSDGLQGRRSYRDAGLNGKGWYGG